LVIAACFLEAGCRDGLIIWRADCPSPDGSWLASARTIENSGFGTGAVITIVSLKRRNDSKPPAQILSLWHDPRIAAPSGATINLAMKWVTPTHLEVTYCGHADAGYQVVKYYGIDISSRDLSPGTTSPSP